MITQAWVARMNRLPIGEGEAQNPKKPQPYGNNSELRNYWEGLFEHAAYTRRDDRLLYRVERERLSVQQINTKERTDKLNAAKRAAQLAAKAKKKAQAAGAPMEVEGETTEEAGADDDDDDFIAIDDAAAAGDAAAGEASATADEPEVRQLLDDLKNLGGGLDGDGHAQGQQCRQRRDGSENSRQDTAEARGREGGGNAGSGAGAGAGGRHQAEGVGTVDAAAIPAPGARRAGRPCKRRRDQTRARLRCRRTPRRRRSWCPASADGCATTCRPRREWCRLREGRRACVGVGCR